MASFSAWIFLTLAIDNVFRLMSVNITRIISDGQAGVDRAALDAAMAMGVVHGGWCPRGRAAEDGPIDPRYRLKETDSPGYRQRTRLNVLESSATLSLNEGPLSGGTSITLDFARRFGKPHIVAQLDEERLGDALSRVVQWLEECETEVLNVAGPGERKRPGIHGRALAFLLAILESCA